MAENKNFQSLVKNFAVVLQSNPEEFIPEVQFPDGEGNTIAYKKHDGIHYFALPWLHDILKNLTKLKMRNDDVLISAFPKSGTNWVWEIVSMIMNKSANPIPSMKTEGFIEAMKSELLDGYASPRVVNTHVLPHLLPSQVFEKKLKLLVVLRNPKDVVVSFYNHTKAVPFYQYTGTFKGYFDVFFEGNNAFGSWFDHTLAWEEFLKSYPKDKCLVLYYEELKRDLPNQIRTISKFLEQDVDDSLINAIAFNCDFVKMRDDKVKLIMKPEHHLQEEAYERMQQWFRKGQVGDWKNHLTVEQSERMDAKFKEKMLNCSFKFTFE